MSVFPFAGRIMVREKSFVTSRALIPSCIILSDPAFHAGIGELQICDGTANPLPLLYTSTPA
jgi:hypothetical protein